MKAGEKKRREEVFSDLFRKRTRNKHFHCNNSLILISVSVKNLPMEIPESLNTHVHLRCLE